MQLGCSDVTISSIVLGTWQAGKDMWAGIRDQDIISAIHASISAGVTSIDTAAIYGNGYSELLIGKALNGIQRDSVQIFTKVFPTHLVYNKVIESCENSLRRLATDYIDLLQIHWPSGAFGSAYIPMEESLSAFETLRKQGKIKAVGVSNFSAKQISEALKYAPIASNQPPYSILWRQSEEYAINYSQENNIATLAYSSLAQGLLSEKNIIPSLLDEKDNRRNSKLMNQGIYPLVEKCIAELRNYAREKHLTLSELALAWITSKKNCAAIVGARNSEQAEKNAKALSVVLSCDEISEVNNITECLRHLVGTDPVLWE